MITPAFGLTATERVLPKLALDFTTAVLDARVTVTRTTNATNPATYIDSSGVITAATNNQPRFDYDPVTLLCRGLRIEEPRANSLLNTDLLATQIVTVTAAVRTLSFYGTGSVTLSGAHVAVVSGTGAYPTRTTYSFTPSAGVLTLTVTGTVQFAQLEAGAFATSYIPTTTTSLTRNADVVQMTGTNFSDWYNATEGTFALVSQRPLNSTGGVSINDGTTNNRFLITGNGNNTDAAYCFVGGAPQAAIVLAASNDGLTNTKVFAYKTNSFAYTRSGIVPLLDATGTLPTVDRLEFISAGASQIVAKLSYFPQRLTNNEVQAQSK